MLARVHEHLADGGRFMVDTCYRRPDQMIDVLEEVEWFTLTHPQGRQIYVSGAERFDHLRQLWIQTCFERWDDAAGELVRPPWELTLRYVPPLDMEALLHYNGFKILARYGEYDGLPYSEDSDGGPIYVCEKC